MSNMKIVSMIAHAEKRQHAETEAVTKDLYAALAPLRSRLDALEREVEQLKALKELAQHLRVDQ